MKALAALFALVALGAFAIGHSQVQSGPAPAQTALSSPAPAASNPPSPATSPAATRLTTRVAVHLPLRNVLPHSTPLATPATSHCKPLGMACTDNTQCCSNFCDGAKPGDEQRKGICKP